MPKVWSEVHTFIRVSADSYPRSASLDLQQGVTISKQFEKPLPAHEGLIYFDMNVNKTRDVHGIHGN